MSCGPKYNVLNAFHELFAQKWSTLYTVLLKQNMQLKDCPAFLLQYEIRDNFCI